MRGEGEDGVGQAALLADLLEQPAAHAAAERGVEHAEGEAAVVVAGEAGHAEHDVGLLGGLGEHADVAGAAGAERAACAAGRAAASPSRKPGRAERLAHEADHGGVVDVAGGRDDHVLGAVLALVEARGWRAG